MAYSDSSYKFTNPIRYFKANDPIYYEVDNIPLKQLQENDLWLKDQVTTISDTTTSIAGLIKNEFDRSSFSELKPYCDGTNNVIKVRPGRFSARINDAYNLTPLQIIKTLTGQAGASGEYNSWEVNTLNSAGLSAVINKFRQDVITQTALNMNGLAERAFSYPAYIPDRVSDYLASGVPAISDVAGQNSVKQPPYPLWQAQLWNSIGNGNQTYVIRQYDANSVNIGFASLGAAESEFIKKWRGIARTSIVDVPEELSIEVPPFNVNDFSYFASGTTVPLINANQRIDLLFIYSKSVDTSGATIAKFVNNNPTVITRAELGIVRGAGVGVDFTNYPEISKVLRNTRVSPVDGTIRMLPHLGDQYGSNNGFKVSGSFIKGSFPSPDDLMNLAPLLDEEISTNHYGLIGQSILPIAYIVVNKNAIINNNSVNIITNNNIIDIRPFFRTTELTYGERAGIAAAVPAPSLANPIVTQAELDYEVKKVYSNLTSQLTQGVNGSNNLGNFNQPRVIANGVIQGGLFYGVEGALGRALVIDNPQYSVGAVKQELKYMYNYPSDIQDLPDWDLAKWCAPNFIDRGLYTNDRINYFVHESYDFNWDSFRFGSLRSYPGSTGWIGAAILNRFGNGFSERQGTPRERNPTYFYFIKKKIKLPEFTLSGIQSYDVNVNFLNCSPVSYSIPTRGYTQIGQTATEQMVEVETRNIQNIWIEKSKPSGGSSENYFTIYVAWSPRIDKKIQVDDYTYPHIVPWDNRNNSTNIIWPSFIVLNDLTSFKSDRGNYTRVTVNSDNNNNIRPWAFGPESLKQGEIGLATYPTVQYQVIGYPTGWGGTNGSLTSEQTIRIA